MQRLNYRLILLALWLSAATTPAMANDHNGGNGRNACPAGTILHVIYIGGFVRRACVSWALLISRHVPGTSGNPGRGVQDGDGGIDHDAPLPSPQSPAFSGDLNADVKLAIKNCTASSVVSDVEEDAKKAGWTIVLDYSTDLPFSKGMTRNLEDTEDGLAIFINKDKHKKEDSEGDDWPELALTLLHEYYHAKDRLDCRCHDVEQRWESRDDTTIPYEKHTEKRAKKAYKLIFGKPAPGAEGYDKATHGKAPPPCYE